jgi:hypothetical protein
MEAQTQLHLAGGQLSFGRLVVKAATDESCTHAGHCFGGSNCGIPHRGQGCTRISCGTAHARTVNMQHNDNPRQHYCPDLMVQIT